MLDALISLRHRGQKTYRPSTRLLEEESDFSSVEPPSRMKIHLDVRPWMITLGVSPTSGRAFSGRNLTVDSGLLNPYS